MDRETIALLNIILTLIWLLSLLAAIGAGIAKERAYSGFVWGLLLGPVGLLLVLLVLPNLKKKRLKAEAAKEADEVLRRYQASRRS